MPHVSRVAQILTDMPAAFSAGTTLKYQRSNGDYPATQGWTAQLFLAGASVATVSGAATGSDFVFTVPVGTNANQSGSLIPGVYHWLERYTYTSTGEVYDGASGYVTVMPNLASATAGSQQLHLERVLNALEARIEGRLVTAADNEQYGVDTMHVIKIPWEQLEAARARTKEQLRAIAAGGTFSRPVLVKFNGIGLRS